MEEVSESNQSACDEKLAPLYNILKTLCLWVDLVGKNETQKKRITEEKKEDQERNQVRYGSCTLSPPKKNPARKVMRGYCLRKRDGTPVFGRVDCRVTAGTVSLEGLPTGEAVDEGSGRKLRCRGSDTSAESAGFVAERQ